MKLPFFIARRFVAGETLHQAIPEVLELNKKGIKATMDLLGENVSDRHLAGQTVHAYLALMDGIRDHKVDSTISVKLTMLGLDIDRSFCRDNLFELLNKAKENRQFVRIDMEGS
ncbi:proline dehydrogenase family protein, partial [Balneolaceae bacterium ANBcel3]|nr:proline dehydrogenase family protein [Balneolaceae bacterium ANBcel3]